LPRQDSVEQSKQLININRQLLKDKPTMKKVILYMAIVSALTTVAQAQNENITWQTPTAVSGASDVNTLGTIVGTWAPGDDTYNPDSLPVNGVTFNAYGSGLFNGAGFSTSGFDSHYDYFQAPSTPNGNYNTILQAAVYNGSGNPGATTSITWGGMTPGDTYLLEFWANDGRGYNDRSETLTGGANTSGTLEFGTGAEYIIGTFVADSTGDETITLNGGASDDGSYPMVNLLEISDITSVPEPSTIALLASGAGAMFFGFRRKCRVI
jgi:hypothetical protein